MVVWRIQDAQYPVINSEGARLTGGRWNQKGVAVIYASENAALAAIEILNYNFGIPDNYIGIRITIPDDIAIYDPDIPPGWPDLVPRAVTAGQGTEWVQRNTHAVMRVPSATMSIAGFNYILNPAHPDFRRIVFEAQQIEFVSAALRR